MRALVTGGTGFVGSAVVRALLAEGWEVACLVRGSSDRRNLQGLEVKLVWGDLGDQASLARAISGCDVLYHVAALYSSRAEDADELFRVNVEGTRHVLRAAWQAGVARIVHTSTIGTIGQPVDGRLATEQERFQAWESASPYARSKLKAEELALDLAAQGAPIVVVNPCAPVGARDVKPSSTGQRILDYLRGHTPSFSPGGINFVSVEDVAQGHLLAAEKGRLGQRYILGHLQGNLQLDDFYCIMERITGLRPPGQDSRLRAALGRSLRALGQLAGLPLARETGPAGHRPAALTADPSLAVRELGLPQTPLEVAFAQAVDWFRGQGYI
ncbi:MAG: NAD-dependent epimerase/dehydratase family protein [Anaerolineae bacterium]|nr:NAD-dependent epimerase/dehydratase family protein [Anaerolineae bacterium]